MAQKRFGPTNDAGVVLIEKDSEKTIVQSAFGSTAYTGILERGDVGTLIAVSGKKDLLAKTGGYIPDSILPDACRHFWEMGDGAGTLFLYRVTDGKEAKASLVLWNRRSERGQVVKVEAKNGGGWGGRRQRWLLDLADVNTDIAEATVDLPIAFAVKEDQLKGGRLYLPGANGGAGGSWDIIGNDPSDGLAKTEVRLALDSKADTEFGAAVDATCILEVGQTDQWGRDKNLAVVVKDGQQNPSTDWGLEVYLDGDLVRNWPDLSSDPNSERYFVDLINKDGANHYITVTDLWVGSITADIRPANHYGVVADTEITAKQLKIGTAAVLVDSSLAGANTIATFTFGTDVIADRLEVTYNTGAAKWDVVSLDQQAQHSFNQATGGVAYPADTKFSVGFTITESTPSNGEKFVLHIIPLEVDEAIDGRIYFPEEAGAPAGGWIISDNDETNVNIAVGDLTLNGTLAGDTPYRLEYKQELGFGYDGIAGITEADFLPAYDVADSEFNKLAGKGYGLIKFATPGITKVPNVDEVQVEKAGINYAATKNHQYREEIPENITDEFAAKAYVQDTLGKNTYKKTIFPGWCTITHPVLRGRQLASPTSGMVHGREALYARNYDGYHKVAAGTEATLPLIIDLPTGDKVLNGEILNPAGIQTIRKKGGNFVIWGARIPTADSAYIYTQHRELISHYEHVMAENFEYIIFAINDSKEWPGLLANFAKYFRPEWRKRALRGKSFAESASFKIDEENNTDATAAAAQLLAEVKLRPAETVEQFIITVSKAGIGESLA